MNEDVEFPPWLASTVGVIVALVGWPVLNISKRILSEEKNADFAERLTLGATRFGFAVGSLYCRLRALHQRALAMLTVER